MPRAASIWVSDEPLDLGGGAAASLFLRYHARMDAFLAIVSKRDQRQYAVEDVPEEVVERVLEAGRVAGSAMNRQPWRFIVLSDELREGLAEAVYAPDNLRGAPWPSPSSRPGSPASISAAPRRT